MKEFIFIFRRIYWLTLPPLCLYLTFSTLNFILTDLGCKPIKGTALGALACFINFTFFVYCDALKYWAEIDEENKK